VINYIIFKVDSIVFKPCSEHRRKNVAQINISTKLIIEGG